MQITVAVHAGEFGHIFDIQAFQSEGAAKSYVKKREKKVGVGTYQVKPLKALTMDDVEATAKAVGKLVMP